nr:DUF3221 domain-containing protein [Lysinibacillus timonensis]
MTFQKWLIGISIVLFVGILSLAIFSFSIKSTNYENTPSTETPSVVNTNEKGVVGHVIINDASIYFIHENDLPVEDIKNILWSELSTFMGHPSDYLLFGKPVEAIIGELRTGDKVEIWYSVVLESHPAQIKVEKIQKL